MRLYEVLGGFIGENKAIRRACWRLNRYLEMLGLSVKDVTQKGWNYNFTRDDLRATDWEYKEFYFGFETALGYLQDGKKVKYYCTGENNGHSVTPDDYEYIYYNRYKNKICFDWGGAFCPDDSWLEKKWQLVD